MTIELLIHALVRQTTILIAQLATAHGSRAPLAQVANQVFLDLVRELDRQGVSRKVSADMFGVGLRTYRRKIQRLSESVTERGRSLWEVVLEYVRSGSGVARHDVLLRFARDDEAQVRAVLRDLCSSGLLVSAGPSQDPTYRAASDEELAAFLGAGPDDEGADELLMALMYREGPLTLPQIAARAQRDASFVQSALDRLAGAGRLQRIEGTETRYHAQALTVPIGASVGWEAAVFDHYKALVTTVLARLDQRRSTDAADRVGGSTYTIDVWPGHPLEEEARGTLARFRASLSDLRSRVDAHNAAHEVPEERERVVIYCGQNVIAEGPDHGA